MKRGMEWVIAEVPRDVNEGELKGRARASARVRVRTSRVQDAA